MRGRVLVWKRDFNNPHNRLFGWGFIAPEGCRGNKTSRVYFNERGARYSPVKSGDIVEFELMVKPENSSHASKAAYKVEKINEPSQSPAAPVTIGTWP